VAATAPKEDVSHGIGKIRCQVPASVFRKKFRKVPVDMHLILSSEILPLLQLIYLRNPPVQKDRWCFEIQLIIAVGSGKRRFKKLLTFHPFFLLRRHRSGHLVAQIFHAITSDHISPFWF